MNGDEKLISTHVLNITAKPGHILTCKLNDTRVDWNAKTITDKLKINKTRLSVRAAMRALPKSVFSKNIIKLKHKFAESVFNKQRKMSNVHLMYKSINLQSKLCERGRFEISFRSPENFF